MKAISYLGKIEKQLGVPVTTRNWNTIQKVADSYHRDRLSLTAAEPVINPAQRASNGHAPSNQKSYEQNPISLRFLILRFALQLGPGNGRTRQPPNGNNERAEVSQWIGPVQVSIAYHSPRVHFQGSGTDRPHLGRARELRIF